MDDGDRSDTFDEAYWDSVRRYMASLTPPPRESADDVDPDPII